MAFLVINSFRSFSRSSFANMFVQNVTVIGGGVMGSGIAQIAAQTGHDVILADVSEHVLDKAGADIKKNLATVAKKKYVENTKEGERFISETLSRLKTSTNLEDSVKTSDLVIEAIVENLHIKQELFKKLDKAAPSSTVFTSNTSSLSITDIASVTERKDRFGGLHFCNPPAVVKLLEVVRTAETSTDTYNKMISFGRKLGKHTITCKDTPGFVLNRLLIPYLVAAVTLMEKGDATTKDIDTAMKLGAGCFMGPFEMLDRIGLDTAKYVLEGWKEKFPDSSCDQKYLLLNKLVAEGKLGAKTGEGFYKYQM